MQTRTIEGGSPTVTFPGLTVKTIVVHTVTYFVMGLLALRLLEYRTAFEAPTTREYMRPVTDPIVALGPSLQFIRAVLFAIAFYPLRMVVFARRNGWRIMWLLLVTLGILAPFAAAPGSVEGLLYTKLPIRMQFSGWLEIVTQALLLSVILHYWVNHREKKGPSTCWQSPLRSWASCCRRAEAFGHSCRPRPKGEARGRRKPGRLAGWGNVIADWTLLAVRRLGGQPALLGTF